MTASKKRSLSDMHRASRVSHRFDDTETYRMMVLRFDEPEEDVDRHFLQTALELGINIPQDPRTTLERITAKVSTLDITPPTPTTPDPHLQPVPRTPRSTHTASDSSYEQPQHRKTPSLAATSITSIPSISSLSSQASNYDKVKKGFRRISTIRRRKTFAVQTPDIPARPATPYLTRPGLQTRALTSDNRILVSHPQPRTSDSSFSPTSPPASPIGKPTGRRKTTSLSSPAPPPPLPSSGSPPPPPASSSPTTDMEPERSSSEPEAESPDPDAIARSQSHPKIRSLRSSQLQEKSRFISFQASQVRLMRKRNEQEKRDAFDAHKQLQQDSENRHAEALSALENRHLSAEVDLRRTLDIERQACDIRLKHMQAYCNPRSTVQGMPERTVTKADYSQLEQQYHVRNGMDNLHTSRINVLREKQAKQLERITAKQEAEDEKLLEDFGRESEQLEQLFEEDERRLTVEFSERRMRLVNRWALTEAIERRKLELETGERFGALPVLEWGDVVVVADDGGGG